jgi:hypothetical protein
MNYEEFKLPLKYTYMNLLILVYLKQMFLFLTRNKYLSLP